MYLLHNTIHCFLYHLNTICVYTLHEFTPCWLPQTPGWQNVSTHDLNMWNSGSKTEDQNKQKRPNLVRADWQTASSRRTIWTANTHRMTHCYFPFPLRASDSNISTHTRTVCYNTPTTTNCLKNRRKNLTFQHLINWHFNRNLTHCRFLSVAIYLSYCW